MTSLEHQNAWLSGYKGEPIPDFHKHPAAWRDAYVAGQKAKARDIERKPKLDATIAEVRAHKGVQDA